MNTITVHGRLTKDITTGQRQGQNGEPYTWAMGTIAVNRDRENADFITFAANGKRAEVMAQYLHKGSEVLIQGSLAVNNKPITDANGQPLMMNGKQVYTTSAVINVAAFDFCGSNNQASAGQAPVEQAPQTGFGTQGQTVAQAPVGQTPVGQAVGQAPQAPFGQEDFTPFEGLPFK